MKAGSKSVKKVRKGIQGRTTGMSIQNFWCDLFTKNESKKLPDTELTKLAFKEFPGRGKKVFHAVSTIRSRFNRGLMTQGVRPKLHSSPHNRKSAKN